MVSDIILIILLIFITGILWNIESCLCELVTKKRLRNSIERITRRKERGKK